MLMKCKLWFSSIGCLKDEEKPLPRLGLPSLRTNVSQTQTRPGPKSRKPSRLHLPPIIQQHKLKLLLPHSTRTRRTLWNLTNTSSHSSSSLSTLKSLTTMLCWNSSSMASTHRLWYSLLSLEQSKPPRLKKATAASPHLGEGSNHPIEEVVTTMIPMLWMWIASHYPQLNALATCIRTAASSAIRKAVLLGIILITIAVSWHANLKQSQTAHARAVSTTPHLTPTPSCQDDPLDSFLKDITKTQGHDQVFCTLRSTFDISLDKQGNPLVNKLPAVTEWNKSARVLTIEAMSHISLPDHHVSF